MEALWDDCGRHYGGTIGDTMEGTKRRYGGTMKGTKRRYGGHYGG